VWLSGVKIGIVKSVQIVSEGKVIVSLSLKDKQNEFIKKNATAYVGSDGFVGNKIVVIRPGTYADIIHDNDTINALSPTDTQELFNIAKEVGVNARSISDDIKLISSRLNKGEGIFGELLRDGPISNEVRMGITALKKAGENSNQITHEAKKLMDKINQGDGLITKLINDSTYSDTFESTLQDLSTTGANTKVMSDDLKEIIARINTNDNAIGVLLSDSVFAQKLRLTLDNTHAASLKLDQNMEAMKHNFLFRGYFRKQQKKQQANTVSKQQP
jgi:phospholipid/cholesterol/gamma-HCH transport system substrate-binding protein